MSKSALITQSNYIPWKGYFDAINLVDEVILLDDVQYTRGDWRNRNRIKSPQGLLWLSIPVSVKGRRGQSIRETRVARRDWADHHLMTLRHCYRRSEYFSEYEAMIDGLYRRVDRCDFLSEINRIFIAAICDHLGIPTIIRQSSEFEIGPGKTERLVSICRQSDISDYFTGPSAKGYLDEAQFAAADVRVHYIDYSGYRAYRQLYGSFEHSVSVLDLLFNTGPSARAHMKTFPESRIAGD